MDVNGYLRRFLDVTYHLPEPNHEDFCTESFHRFELAGYFDGKKGETLHERENFQYMLPKLFSLLNLRLRDIEKCFSLLSICCLSTPDNFHLFGDLLSILIVLKIMHEDLYKLFVNGKMTKDEMLDFIKKKNGGNDFLESHEGIIFEATVVFGLDGEENKRCQEEYNSILNNENSDEEVRTRTANIVDMMKHYRFKSHGCPTEYLAKKINLAQDFEL
jgi:hypothetical protein